MRIQNTKKTLKNLILLYDIYNRIFVSDKRTEE